MPRLVVRTLRAFGWRGRAARRKALVGRRDPQGALPQDFSAAQYVELNPDLAGLAATPHAAEEHYVLHGAAEGRLYRFDEDRFGQVPADFDADGYLDINPDLERLRGHPLAAKGHYLARGRNEGRSYKAAGSAHRGRAPSILRHPPVSAWRSLFKAGDFRALHPELAGEADTATDLLAAFELRGIDKIAALSLEFDFEPGFYAERFPETAALSPAARYLAWLEHGIPAGRPGSEAEAVRNLIGLPGFPSGFDWRSYTADLGPAGRRLSRLEALEHAVANAAGSVAIPTVGPTGAAFLIALSDALWTTGRRGAALRVLRTALVAFPDDGDLHHKMATRCIEVGRSEDAEQHERRALALGKTSIWACTNLAALAAQRGDPAESYRMLERSRVLYEGWMPWREALRGALEADYAATADRAWALYGAGAREEADAMMTAGLERVAERIRTLDDLPGHVGPTSGGHVVLFANHLLPQCRHYRVEQRCRQLDLLGILVRVFPSDGADLAREALVGARALIVYREPAFTGTIRLLVHARTMGVPTYYDIDDLIFEAAHYPEGFDTFEKQITHESYVGLLYGVPLVRFAIGLCDAALTSTTALAGHVAPLTAGSRCDVVPNGLDDRNTRFLQAPPLRSEGGEVLILYGSGSRAHDRNFNDTVGAALVALMAAHPEVVLVIAGYLGLDPAFTPFADRIRTFPFSPDVESYWALLSEIDINLAVLTPGAMNDGKSEIKWLEAAVSGVPSIVSSSRRYREVVRDGIDGILAGSPESWRDALFRLVEDRDLRHRIGATARERVRVDYALDATAAHLAAALAGSETVAPPTTPRASRMRVLVVHVLFPPQSLGGATRVVRDNVDDMLDRYADAVELAVFTSDFDLPVPGTPDEAGDIPTSADHRRTSRVGRYRSIPVFRISRGTDSEFTFRDEETRQRFAAVLAAWKPDVVHVHCIQFLTASLVEACREAAIPYVVTLHDAWWISSSQFLIDEHNLLQSPGVKALTDGALAMADVDRRRFLADQLAGAAARLAVSESFAEVYRRAGFPDTRAVTNGLSPLFLEPVERTTTGSPGRIRLGHVGGLSQHKGSHLLRLALEAGRFANLEIVLVDHEMLSDQRQSAKWGTTPVTIRGPAEQGAMRDLYAEFDVLVAPSIWPESYGLVSREALAMGLWVIASDLGALGEDIVEGENGFRIDVRDARDLERVLRIIEEAPDRFREPPARRIRPRLASAQTDDLVAIYREVAASHPAPR